MVIREEEEIQQEVSGEAYAKEDRDNILRQIFDTKTRIENLKHRWKGEVIINDKWVAKNEALADESFINDSLNMIESVVDTTNAISKKDDLECKAILHNTLEQFILSAYQERSIKDKNFGTIIQSFENILELFLGLVEFEQGANVLRDVTSGLNHRKEETEKKQGVAEWLKSKLN